MSKNSKGLQFHDGGHGTQPQTPDGISKSVAISQSHTMLSGPFPPADEWKKYYEIDPSVAERIIQFTERNLEHRIAMDVRERDGKDEVIKCFRFQQECSHNENMEEFSIAKRGQNIAAILACLFLGGAIFAGLRGLEWLAGILGGATAVDIVALFIARIKRSKNTDEDED
jgi:uncharacterized membrane protein